MRIVVLRVGVEDVEVMRSIQVGLCEVFSGTVCEVFERMMVMPRDAYDVARGQFLSSSILSRVWGYVESSGFDRVLGVTDVDLFVPGLNFVFGEAECPGRAAIISLCRLRSEFYGGSPGSGLLVERSVKEAVHEVGHTLGLGHCQDSLCVMFFSNSVDDTDRKRSVFCEKCGRLVVECLKRV
jgi:archaemetzincin